MSMSDGPIAAPAARFDSSMPASVIVAKRYHEGPTPANAYSAAAAR